MSKEQIAYVETNNVYLNLIAFDEKMAVMEMPCSVTDALGEAIQSVKTARDILFRIISNN